MYKWQKPNVLRCGQVLIVKTEKEIIDEFGAVENVPDKSFTKNVKAFSGKKFHIDKFIKETIKNNQKDGVIVLESDGVSFSSYVLKTNNKDLMENISCEKCDVEKHDVIVEEMISKVNFDLFVKMLASATRGNAYIKDINKDIAKKYLYDWAFAKKDLYLAMGRSLSVKKKVKVNKTESEMEVLIDELSNQFPLYGICVSQFQLKDIINNQITYVPKVYQKYSDGYTKGMKLSKFMSKIMDSAEFDIELSKIMQNREIDATIEVSIDPIDFMTMSIHQHKWSSCYDIRMGCYSNCAFSIMCDKGSVICFKHNEKEYDYKIKTKGSEIFEYKWNSKQSRNVAFFDKKLNETFVFSAQGSPDESYYGALNGILSSISVNYFGVEADVKKNISYYDRDGRYTVEEACYGHIHHDLRYILVDKNNKNDNHKTFIGVKMLYNPVTGAEVRRSAILY